MKKFHDTKEKEIIKNCFQDYEIKTTSETIINKYQSQAEEIKPVHQKRNLVHRLAWACLILIVSGIGIYELVKIPHNITTSSHNASNVSSIPTTNINYKMMDSAAFEIVSGLDLLKNDSTYHLRVKKNLAQSEFENIVNKYEKIKNISESYLTNLSTEYDYLEGSFSGIYSSHYSFKMVFTDGTQFLFNHPFIENDEDEIEKTYEGELVLDSQESKRVKFEFEQEYDDQEIEIKMIIYNSDNDFLELSQEIESDEISYSYERNINGNPVFSLEISKESKNGINYMDAEISENNEEYEFKIWYEDDLIYITYSSDFEGKIQFTAEEENGKTLYKYSNEIYVQL